MFLGKVIFQCPGLLKQELYLQKLEVPKTNVSIIILTFSAGDDVVVNIYRILMSQTLDGVVA